MSEQEAFEKWFIDGFKGGFPTKSLDGLSYSSIRTTNLWQAWQAANAEANKRIDALQGEVALARSNEAHADDQRIKCIRKYKTQVAELQASNNDLREALEEISIEVYKDQSDLNTIRKVIEISKGALSATPAESLQAHDDEVIEKCAKVCDEDAKQSREFAEPFAARCAELLAEAIRALKGK